jgi:putative transposase
MLASLRFFGLALIVAAAVFAAMHVVGNDYVFYAGYGRRFRCPRHLADKGYDADHLCGRIAQTGGQPVIPPKRNPTSKRPYEAELYKKRHVIERFFNKLKHFHRVATRYDKLLANFIGFVKLAAIAISLK